MSEVAQKLYEIISIYANKKSPEDVAAAAGFEELGLDSVALIAILDEIEEQFGVKLDEDPNVSISMADFVKLIEDRVAAKNA
jgi:acyl carrier protein